jgi:hypothetical protein
MSTTSELQQFYEFLGQQLRAGSAEISPEQAVDIWRMQQPPSEDLLAIQEALDDMERGDTGIPFEEFDQEFRARHGISND